MRILRGKTKLDGVRSTSLTWTRFNLNQTSKAHGTKLLRETILETVVSATLPEGSTHHDVILEIVHQSKTPLAIVTIPEVFNEGRSARGRSLFGFCGTLIDRVVRNYDGMEWWVSEKGLHIELSAASGLSKFDLAAGKLMFDARPRRGENNRLKFEEYIEIARELDEAGFRPIDHLERKDRKELARWNERHPRIAIKTFSGALSANIPSLNLRRAVQKRLSRAESNWMKQAQLSSE